MYKKRADLEYRAREKFIRSGDFYEICLVVLYSEFLCPRPSHPALISSTFNRSMAIVGNLWNGHEFHSKKYAWSRWTTPLSKD